MTMDRDRKDGQRVGDRACRNVMAGVDCVHEEMSAPMLYVVMYEKVCLFFGGMGRLVSIATITCLYRCKLHRYAYDCPRVSRRGKTTR